MTDIGTKLLNRYPQAPFGSFWLRQTDHGLVIDAWDEAVLGPQPTLEEIATWDLPSTRRLVPKSLVHARIIAAGKAPEAKALLDDPANAAEWMLWFSPGDAAVYADDPRTIAKLQAIGLDPVVILAPEEGKI